jgi:hypothetical protein
MLGLIFGPLALILGLKGFPQTGMPFTKRQRITGATAKIIGVFCVALGVLMTLGGVMSVIQIVGRATN